MTSAINSFGTLLKRGDGGSPESFATIAEVLDISGPGLKANTEDVTNHGSSGGYEEIIVTTLAAGDVKFDLNFQPVAATHSQTSGLLLDFKNKTKRNFQLVFPDSGTTTWAFSGYVTGFEPKAPVKGKLSATVTLSLTGAPTLAG
jgi:hypothetical protein